ncbi:MAG: polysaccharide deacetylase family protein [Acidimicrobiales bacterium]
MPSLAERLGYGADDRLLILNCDDLGFCHSANEGVYESLRRGIGTSASLMVPCPWAPGAARCYDGEDVGVHLTLTSEWEPYRWGPLTASPSLVDEQRRLPRTSEAVWGRAAIDDVRRELRAQVDQALAWGIDVTHLDAHMGTVQVRPEFFSVYLELAAAYRLPMRLSGAESEAILGFPFRGPAAEKGVTFTDHFIHAPGVASRSILIELLPKLRPGVTEAYLHPAVDSPELRAAAPDWERRVDDHRLLVHDDEVQKLLDAHGIQLIGFRALRECMRSA